MKATVTIPIKPRVVPAPAKAPEPRISLPPKPPSINLVAKIGIDEQTPSIMDRLASAGRSLRWAVACWFAPSLPKLISRLSIAELLLNRLWEHTEPGSVRLTDYVSDLQEQVDNLQQDNGDREREINELYVLVEQLNQAVSGLCERQSWESEVCHD